MNFQQAQTAATPFITPRNARDFAALQTDQMLWIEENIMDPAGIHATICSDFGERVCLWIEEQLEGVAK